MKRLLVLSCFMLAASALTDLELWREYKTNHGKAYNALEDRARFRTFVNTLRKIEAHNERYEKGETTYKMAVTKYSDWTEEEIDHSFRSFENVPLNDRRKLSKEVSKCGKSRLGINPPASYDWRDQNLVTEVKHQGSCGSGWAFAAAGALETLIYFFTKQLRSISAEGLVDCFAPPFIGDENGCGNFNGTLKDVYDFMVKDGFTFEEDYPYVAGQSGKSGECQSSKFTEFMREYTIIPPEDEAYMLEVVAFQSPLAVEIDARALSSYGSGILGDDAPCSIKRPNHAVVVVGYGTENGTDYWVLKNSWGPNWGEKGFFRVERGYNVCGVAAFPIAPVFRC